MAASIVFPLIVRETFRFGCSMRRQNEFLQFQRNMLLRKAGAFFKKLSKGPAPNCNSLFAD